MKQFIRLWFSLVVCMTVVSCTSVQETLQANYEVVPLPKEISVSSDEAFILSNATQIAYIADNSKMQRNAEFLAEYINHMLGFKPAITTNLDLADAIVLNLSEEGSKESYQIDINKNNILISGASEAGVFYGIQTLRKSLPVAKGANISFPAGKISDEPRFEYRGMMLDVSRHFFPLDFVKRYIDILALHNINTFHWHLSEDQGWRIEIKKYPKLTEIGSQRKETVIGRNSGEYDGTPYGGFYTQDEAKEIVAYAQERYITVIPEIDMPGHMQAALAAYPELGCTGGPYEVWTQWGISDDVLCAGNPKTIEFIKDVLSEIIEIFPSHFIHIGGDECPKVRWETCPKCQAKISELGIKSDKEHSAVERLQSYVISEAEKFLNDNGRQIIGWDEILEGGLAPNATVMSWRGMAGGIQAAKMKHNVIMTPTTHVYFDYYQAQDTENEPLAIGGYLPLEQVYNLEPVPASLTAEEAKYVIGAQANLWTEYIPTTQQAEYMVLPRIAALSEVQWCDADQKDYNEFLGRLLRLVSIYDLEGYNYATHVFDIKANYTPNFETETLDVMLSTIDGAPIHYTLDGSEPNSQSPIFEEVLPLDKSCTLKAVVVRSGKNSRVLTEEVSVNKSFMKPIEMVQPINKQYFYNGAPTLVDGLSGNNNYKTGRWIAFYKNDLEAIIDLKETYEISSVVVNTCVEKGDWVFDAREISVFVSDDGKNFRSIIKEEYPVMKESDRNGIHKHELNFSAVKARYVKVLAKPEHSMPEWHGGKGNEAFLFVDEIAIN